MAMALYDFITIYIVAAQNDTPTAMAKDQVIKTATGLAHDSLLRERA
jgi:hypothetical protein